MTVKVQQRNGNELTYEGDEWVINIHGVLDIYDKDSVIASLQGDQWSRVELEDDKNAPVVNVVNVGDGQ